MWFWSQNGQGHLFWRFCMNRSLKIGLACAFGAFIGSLVALSLNQFWWWLGMFVGGGVGYLSYELKTVIEATKVAWKQVIGWRPSWQSWIHTGKFFVLSLALPATVLFPIGILCLLLDLALPENNKSLLNLCYLWLAGIPLVGIFNTFIYTNGANNKVISYQEMKDIFFKFNPLVVYFYYVPMYAGIGIWFAIKRIPRLALRVVLGIFIIFARLGTFVWTIFKFIHSEERVLCAFDAALGAGIGYFYHNPIVGMIAGGIFGVLNYEILSKRVLRLVSLKTKS